MTQQLPTPVILSPHFDDAVFNCWNLVNKPGTVVMTICAGAPPQDKTTFWDRLCGTANSQQMMKRRTAENEQALKATDARLVNLAFLDQQYRTDKTSASELADAILAASTDDATYLAPLAGSRIMRHGDHVLVREAALELIRRGKHVAFYPDAPYMHAPRHSSPAFLQHLTDQAKPIVGEVVGRMEILDEALLASKREAMAAYQSQYLMTNLVSLGGLDRLARRNYEVVLTPA